MTHGSTTVALAKNNIKPNISTALHQSSSVANDTQEYSTQVHNNEQYNNFRTNAVIIVCLEITRLGYPFCNKDCDTHDILHLFLSILCPFVTASVCAMCVGSGEQSFYCFPTASLWAMGW